VRIIAGRVADARGERACVMVTVEEGRIVALEPWSEIVRPLPGDVDARDAVLLPGFIDIHVHGGAGRYTMEATADALDAIARHLVCYGVTGFLSTTVTGPWELQAGALSVATQFMEHHEKNGRTGGGAAVLGCHLEGPYINPVKKGAQPEQFIVPPSVEDLLEHIGENRHGLKVITLAPEMPGALELIQFLVHNGVIVSLGHTNATYAEVSAAIDAGARHVTHCFNAMRPMEGREPGVVGAALARPELTAELIWDNVHVHPASCCALVNAKGPDGVILISDGIPGTGMQNGYRFSLGDLPVEVQNGTARLPDGTLAGSLLTLDRAFHNAGSFTLAQRSQMTSYNAACALGIGASKGLISPGYDADLVLLAADGTVRQTFVGGESVYKQEP
jgi:N-acetylglucosamine-6-phosphate deacetylase